MEMQKTVQAVFLQLSDSLSRLDERQYCHACESLSGNSIGQHVRHIIEMFQCLEISPPTSRFRRPTNNVRILHCPYFMFYNTMAIQKCYKMYDFIFIVGGQAAPQNPPAFTLKL